MAKLPLPQRGQPIDVGYISQVATAVNQLAEEMNSSGYQFVTIDTPSMGKQNTRISETKIIAAYVQVNNSTSVTGGTEKEFYYTFPADFKYAPVATATVINVGATDAGEDVTVVLKTVSTSRIDGIVKFNTTGKLSIGVNIIAVGIPT
jgi:methionine synthase II (cobalamin-independent)